MPTQLPRVPSLIPSSFATLAIGRDVSITIFTASSLNSGEKLFLGRGNYFTFPDGPSYWMDCPEGSGHLRTSMAKRILLLGVRATLVEEVRQDLQRPDVEFLGGTGVDDVRSAFGQADMDHVIVGGGLDQQTRAAIVREVFQSSDRATI